MNLHFSFKAKLNMTIVICLLGFALITFISLQALNNLNSAAKQVGDLHQSTELLKDLQVSVLQLQGTSDSQGFVNLQEDYDTQLTALSESSEAQVAANIDAINRALHQWVTSKQQLLVTQLSIGRDLNEVFAVMSRSIWPS